MPQTHLVSTLHLGSRVDCPAPKLSGGREVVIHKRAGSAMSPHPVQGLAWWCRLGGIRRSLLQCHVVLTVCISSSAPQTSLQLPESRNLFILLSLAPGTGPKFPNDFQTAEGANSWAFQRSCCRRISRGAVPAAECPPFPFLSRSGSLGPSESLMPRAHIRTKRQSEVAPNREASDLQLDLGPATRWKGALDVLPNILAP